MRFTQQMKMAFSEKKYVKLVFIKSVLVPKYVRFLQLSIAPVITLGAALMLMNASSHPASALQEPFVLIRLVRITVLVVLEMVTVVMDPIVLSMSANRIYTVVLRKQSVKTILARTHVTVILVSVEMVLNALTSMNVKWIRIIAQNMQNVKTLLAPMTVSVTPASVEMDLTAQISMSVI